MDAESTGHLNLINEDQELSGITFIKGEIAKVDTENTKNTLKALILKKGFVDEDEIAEIEAKKKGSLIKNLIEESLLSPHIVSTLAPEQMIKDLDEIVNDKSVQVNFSPERRLKSDATKINIQAFTHQIHDFVHKIPLEWFKEFYQTWEGHAILEGPQADKNHIILKMPALEAATNLYSSLFEKLTIEEVQDKLKLDEVVFYRALHLLMVNRLFVFDETKKVLNAEEHITRIKAQE